MGPYYDHQVSRFEPPDPVSDRDILLAQARRARAEATRQMLRAAYRGLKAAGGSVAALVGYTGAGAALRPPHGDVRRGRPARLTGACN
jgi:hypothetical protein